MRHINKLAEGVLSLLFAAMIIVGTLQVFNRFFINESLSWSEEFQKYAFIWLVFIAIPVAYNRHAHLRVDSLVALFPEGLQRLLRLVVDLLWLALGVALALLTLRIMQVTQSQESPGLGLSMSWVYCGLFIGGVYQVLCVLHRLYSQAFKEGRP
ncbi:TRAP transporter small permease [Pusillimonas sp. ANT_WB101]|uniref:TRAP transporter small permease n=1 Tax=Pusillimonas sp. ANT_WB101 TaxID=2597356 RepID=UPI00165D5F65|nr:TRAP transporter small permease [Pusillimonas sp. ANT_WB101]